MTEPDPRPHPAPAADAAANLPLSVVAPAPLPNPNRDAAPVLVTDLASKTLAVKEGQTFLYSDLEGNLDHGGQDGLGLYSHDTRFLSHFRLTVNGRDLVLLSSSAERGYQSHVDLTNPDLFEDDVLCAPQQTINVRRVRAISGDLFERIRIKNYNPFDVTLEVRLTFGADFADIFDVRGMTHRHSGGSTPPTVTAPRSSSCTRGATTSGGSRGSASASSRTASTSRGRSRRRSSGSTSTRTRRGSSRSRSSRSWGASRRTRPRTSTTRCTSSVAPTRSGSVSRRGSSPTTSCSTSSWTGACAISARCTRGWGTARSSPPGSPWYVTIFGRDSLIASHQLLTVNTRPARDALELLAARQGTEENDWRDEQPGKILHEVRDGELARAGIMPHSPYYGSVDSTPWFLIVYAQHLRWTGDVAFARKLLPTAEAALAWIDRYGDLDGDGFVEYLCRSPRGIRNQGWKDSHDSIVHADGRLAEPPIALSEVQGYVYLAKTRMADVYRALGRPEDAARLEDEAERLKVRFNEAFWMEDERYFAAALDADKQQLRTLMSNPGHCLYTGIVDEDKALPLAKRLLAPDMFSGWGVRTMSRSAASYNPMSYHNGSVWPHDNALIAAGLKRYGFARATNRVATALFDAAVSADYLRLPELFCGFTRRSPNRPVSYPIACSPQAWAAGSPFLMLQSMLGLSARAHENLLTINLPHLPTWLNSVEVRNLPVGQSKVSMVFRREGEITSFSLLSREGDLRVVMEE